MRKLSLILVSFLIGILLFIFVINFVGAKEIKEAFLVLTGWQGISIFILTLLSLGIGNLKWQMILKTKGEDIPFFTLFKMYLAGFSIMYFLPMLIFGGEIFRGYLVNKKNSFGLAKGIASSIVDRILDWTILLVIIFLGVIIFLFKIGLPSKRVAAIFGGAFLFFSMLIFFFYLKTLRKESIIKSLFSFFRPKYLDKEPLTVEKEIFSFFDFQNKVMWKGFLLAFLANLVFFLRTWFLVSFLENRVGFLSSFSIFSFSSLAAMIPITASLGSHETIQVFVFKSLGLEIASATAFTMVIRGVGFVFALFGIFIFFRLGFKLGKDFLFKNLKNNKILTKELSFY